MIKMVKENGTITIPNLIDDQEIRIYSKTQKQMSQSMLFAEWIEGELCIRYGKVIFNMDVDDAKKELTDEFSMYDRLNSETKKQFEEYLWDNEFQQC